MFSFLDLLESEYADGNMEFLNSASTKECKEFHSKFIQPVIDKNEDVGLAAEDSFCSAIAASENKAFKDGIKAGIKMIMEFSSVSMVRS